MLIKHAGPPFLVLPPGGASNTVRAFCYSTASSIAQSLYGRYGFFPLRGLLVQKAACEATLCVARNDDKARWPTALDAFAGKIEAKALPRAWVTREMVIVGFVKAALKPRGMSGVRGVRLAHRAEHPVC